MVFKKSIFYLLIMLGAGLQLDAMEKEQPIEQMNQSLTVITSDNKAIELPHSFIQQSTILKDLIEFSAATPHLDIQRFQEEKEVLAIPEIPITTSVIEILSNVKNIKQIQNIEVAEQVFNAAKYLQLPRLVKRKIARQLIILNPEKLNDECFYHDWMDCCNSIENLWKENRLPMVTKQLSQDPHNNWIDSISFFTNSNNLQEKESDTFSIPNSIAKHIIYNLPERITLNLANFKLDSLHGLHHLDRTINNLELYNNNLTELDLASIFKHFPTLKTINIMNNSLKKIIAPSILPENIFLILLHNKTLTDIPLLNTTNSSIALPSTVKNITQQVNYWQKLDNYKKYSKIITKIVPNTALSALCAAAIGSIFSYPLSTLYSSYIFYIAYRTHYTFPKQNNQIISHIEQEDTQ